MSRIKCRVWGKGEWLLSGDVFEVCGKRWDLAALSPAGDWIEFRIDPANRIAVATQEVNQVRAAVLERRW
ncbi:MAG TPA: hypothetical protein VEO19_00735 [Terriglobia bacterium]|nr:hypothetical protein [Terriglobia bacterium]